MLLCSGVTGRTGHAADHFTEKAMKDDIGKVEYASLLYDFYGALLSDPQKDIMELYHEDNLSLAEIADETGTSRQAVHYTLKKAEKALEEFEEKLGLIAAYKRSQKLASEALGLIDRSFAGGSDADRLKDLIHKLSE